MWSTTISLMVTTLWQVLHQGACACMASRIRCNWWPLIRLGAGTPALRHACLVCRVHWVRPHLTQARGGAIGTRWIR